MRFCHSLKYFISLFVIFALFLIQGCQQLQPAVPDYSALERSQPRSILVIPPENQTVEVLAPYTLLASLTRPLAEKGYYVFPVAVIDQFLKENGVPTTGEMNQVPLDKLRKYIGPDAVLYLKINEWGQKYEVLTSRTVVSADMRLIDAEDGQLLWQGRAFAQKQSDDGGNGLAGALVGALVTQVVGSLSDQTFPVAREAVTGLIFNPRSGLLSGPYAEQPVSQ